MDFRKKIAISILVAILVIGGIFYFRFEVYYSHGISKSSRIFEIKEGEGNLDIAANLEEKGLISNKWYLYYYLRTHGKLNKLLPGEYELSGNLSIPEIVESITQGKDMAVKLTFPEGLTAKQMAEKLNEKGFPGDQFLSIATDPAKWDFRSKYDFLGDEKITTLEGFLFPDTYFFEKEATAEGIMIKILDNFNRKLTSQMRQDIADRKSSIVETITLASIVEREVQTASDMKIVAGIFLSRIDNGQRLQSDATLSYILGDSNDSHSGKDLELDSPYNSYRVAGLPPTPISNPGMNAILAAIYPQASSYNYFLTSNVNGTKEVLYAKTYDEHLLNKRKAGL